MQFFFDITPFGVKKVMTEVIRGLFFRGFHDPSTPSVVHGQVIDYGPVAAAVSTIRARLHARYCP
jgi:hypothetical protein